MSPPIKIDNIYASKARCLKCKREFLLQDHMENGENVPLLSELKTNVTILRNICPDCLKELTPSGNLRVLKNGPLGVIKEDVYGPGIHGDISEPQIRRTTTDYYSRPTVPGQEMQQKIGNFLFWILVITSISAGLYSFASKFLPLNLPNFPFYPYIIAHAFIFLSIPRRIVWPLLVIVLINFGSATFRSTFFSHFGSTIWMVVGAQ